MLPLVHVALALVVATSAAVVRECVELNGASYRGVKTSSSGETCLNWLNISSTYNLTIDLDSSSGQWDHSYCRNPDASPRPWCFVSTEDGIKRRDCIIDMCQDQRSDVGAEAEAVSSAEGQTEPQSVHPPRETVAVKPDPGISRRVSLGPSRKKDLGALGYALGALLMAVIVLLGAGITIGYVYRRGVKLRLQQEQRAYEQEMHRINLPLSAFTNPACDLSDEQPATASVQQAGEKEERGEEEREEPTELQTNTFESDKENSSIQLQQTGTRADQSEAYRQPGFVTPAGSVRVQISESQRAGLSQSAPSTQRDFGQWRGSTTGKKR
ncbi:phosphoinositide-3-kinase-interacting protein 1-like [Colossoma macropomum]|uniref:phosphoinositide-3-kinase-interacting protein 1-like n=1 Tax=Colossoma macropomum TaxID=42526 RepID=UPI001863F92B|nr:phosphoinositide-3-kinase-interacting protein 1-like [Colossoma macropomum]